MASRANLTARVDLSELIAQLSSGAREAASTPGRILQPGAPLTPTMPQGSDPRAWAIRQGQNLRVSNRPDGPAATPFDQLRTLADYDLVRVAIEDVKAQIMGMEWSITPCDMSTADSPEVKAQVAAAQAFVEQPDPLAECEFQDWLGQVLEEVMVTDAVTIYPQVSLDGRFLGAELIDGATIVPLVDVRGRRPLPPAPAYQQIVAGVMETEFLATEILYLPMNRRANSMYGRSKVEQVLFTVNLALRSTMYDLAFYTDGVVPDSIYMLPETWSPEQIVHFQELKRTILSGRHDLRAGGMEFMPKGEYQATKTRTWDYQFMEWLARVIAWSFGVSPIPIAKQMNRSTGQTMEQSAMESGVRPLSAYIARVINRLLRNHLKLSLVKFAWGEDETDDPEKTALRNRQDVHGGVLTLNEGRHAAGKDPYPPEIGDRPFIVTGSGIVWLDTAAERDLNPPEPEPVPPGLGGPPAPAADDPKPDADADADADQDEKESPQQKAWARAFQRYAQAVHADLATWRRVCIKRVKAGRAAKLAFTSTVIPPGLRADLVSRLSHGAAPRAMDVEQAFNLATWAWVKAEPKPTGKRASAERKIKAVVNRYLKDNVGPVRDWAVAELEREQAAHATKAAGDMPLGDPGDMADDLSAALQGAAAAGASDAATAVGVSLTTPPAKSIAFAINRAGELVGKKFVGGAWVDNPNAAWRIDEALRARVNSAVTQAVEEGWSTQKLAANITDAFGPSRSRTIARTETGFSYGNGASEVYREAGVDLVEILDGDGCLPDSHEDGAPSPSGDVGKLEAGAEADGQIWTLEDYQANVLAHPNCVRAAVPYIPDGAVTPGGGGNE